MLASGATFGAYRIVEPLGRGGMASVYKAYEAALDRYVALKVLPGEFLHDETFAERFRREAKVVARLEHPNIIPIHAFGIEGGIPWMAMRLISGGPLSSLLRGGRLTHERIITILRGVADALDYAHGKGVVHRDVKPQNILLDEAERVYLADFGIAKMVEGSGALTQTGMITGTPQYMAPEQATGQPVDQRVDIYALGVVAYEMLTGRVPFAADTPVAVLMKHVTEPMPIPPASTVPEPLVRALLKGMAKKPEERWSSAGAFVRALEQGLAEVPTASVPVAATATVPAPALRPAPTMPPPGPTTRRTAAPAPSSAGVGRALAILAAIVAVGAVGVFAISRSRSAPPKETTASLSSRGAAVSASGSPAPAPTARVEVLPSTLAATPATALAPSPAPPRAAAPIMAATPVPMARLRPTPSPVPTAPVATAPPANTETRPAPAPPHTPSPTPAAVHAGPTGTLQLDVDAQQDAYTSGASTLYLKLLVDGRPFRDLSIVFEGRETSRARKRQVFDVAGIPTGRRRITLLASASPDVEKDRAEGITEVEVGPGSNRAVVQVRYNGVRFRE
ncbi:MAG TPA: protein kinase, partial [Vicinamibacteria bacterium]